MGAQGNTSIDFGAFPGTTDASLAVTGQGAIVGGSLVEAWLFPADTADHLADEHFVETIKIMAGNVVAGVGFTIYARNDNPLIEPDPSYPYPEGIDKAAGIGTRPGPDGRERPDTGVSRATCCYGLWSVAWVWN